MIHDKRILAIIPARGGSKGVPKKNIQPLLGIPLIGWTGILIQAISCIDRSIVSTDSPEIAIIAKKYNIDAPFLRPPSLSGDFIGDWEVLFHALNAIEEIDKIKYDIILMLQPTSPLRTSEHVMGCINLLLKGDFDSVWTISHTDLKFHPLKQLTISENGKLNYYDEKGCKIIARQQLTPIYHRNGACYAFKRDCLIEQKTIFGINSSAIIIEDPIISIDTIEDFKKIELILTAGKSSLN